MSMQVPDLASLNEVMFKGIEELLSGIDELRLSKTFLKMQNSFYSAAIDIVKAIARESKLSNCIKAMLESITGLPIASVRVNKVSNKYFVVATVNASASTVLEKWLEIADMLRGTSILFEWAGETDVSPVELGTLLGKIFAKQGVFLISEESFNVVKLLNEEWE
uniref:Uncharacterized protein n=1 Tax=Ignisphaera aggregans TaxID=334771 RepID=A0A7J2U0P4_9CREN